ncbi:MAG: hypothetical protein JNG88_09490 [Phycisphaerales bacterium]|nr:hypothetical protein [Phycisphaerales bacterium]
MKSGLTFFVPFRLKPQTRLASLDLHVVDAGHDVDVHGVPFALTANLVDEFRHNAADAEQQFNDDFCHFRIPFELNA